MNANQTKAGEPRKGSIIKVGTEDGWILGSPIEERFCGKGEFGKLFQVDCPLLRATGVAKLLKNGKFVFPLIKFGRNEQVPPGGAL